MLKKEQKCRLCNGELKEKFKIKVLMKYNVKYYICNKCFSLQTECPYWLDEAYKKQNLSYADTGAAQRNLKNYTTSFMISKLLCVKNVIDIGGGDGLLCRLLRDQDINCFVRDKYAIPTYAQGYTEPNFSQADLVLGFEVIEHYPNPSADLDELFKSKPNTILLSTNLYKNQGKEWWYLIPESGQHIFFYSKKSLNGIADKYGYSVIVSGEYILFIKEPSTAIKIAAKVILNKYIIQIAKSIVILLPTPGVWKDHESKLTK